MAIHRAAQCLLLFMLSCVVWGYNFDTLVPTIVTSGVGSSDGFGFSMTQHEFSDGRKVALVSSPMINGSDFFGDPVDSEGGVYSCPFDDSQTCQFEPVFQTKDDSNPLADQLFSILSGDNRSYEGQLLGYSLRSFETHVVACAPLYVNTIIVLPSGDNHATPTGRCVVLNRDLSDAKENILQITNNDLEGSPMTLGGVDIDIINMDIGGGVAQRIAIGSAFGGAPSGDPPGQVIVTSLDPATHGDDNTTASSQESSPDVTELLGYKIELGRFTDDKLQIASSAPRANMHRGQIKIFNIPVNGTLSEQLPPLNGPEPDGYFGYDFVAHSFSEDGQYHSLVVGCPLCDEDRGAVYLYLHSGDPSDPFPSDPVHIPSPDTFIPGRFGMAVAVIGDSDGDGISDVAISAPYLGSGGVVYICRGFRGGILTPEQAIPAVPMANAFGYTLSGGLDIDDNGYPDLTVGDLTGLVTTIRTSPLVTVVIEFDDLQSTVDLVEDRKCRITDDITLLCFNVTPCFYYEALHSVEVPQFAFQYSLTVDGAQPAPRVVLLDRAPGEDGRFVIVTENSLSDNITMTGAGEENRICVGPFTFAIRADFAGTVPIPVTLEISESDSVPPLPADPATPTLGGPLTPVLRRYIEGDQPVVTAITQNVEFGLNCNGEFSPACEPNYTITITPSFDVDEPLLLAPGVSFSYDVFIENTAQDDGLNPILVLELPNGVLLDSTVSHTMGAVTDCESSGSSQPQCLLQNPLHSKTNLSLTVSFRFNSSAIPLTTPTLSIHFTVVDGTTGNTSTSSTFKLRAEASFDVGVIVSEDQYQARRHALTQDASTIPLIQTGPTIRLSVLVSNSRGSANGTTIPVSTLLIHLPVAVQPDRNANLRPLLIPFRLLSASENINCNHYNAVPDDLLSPVQRPSNFIPLGPGMPPEDPSLEECEGQRGELRVRCGTIVCDVRELEAGAPPSQLTVFAYLFSPSIIVREDYSVYAGISTAVEGLEITDTEDDLSTVSFEVLPAVIEVSLDCFQYWIIVVAVVAGLLGLLILVAALAFCGVFGRWYKRRGDISPGYSTDTVDGQPSRASSTVTLRTVPPLPGMVIGGSVKSVRSETGEEVKVDLDKETEGELERQQEAELIAAATVPQAPPPPPLPPSVAPTGGKAAGGGASNMDIRLDQYTFDPHIGVSEDDGDETEI